VLLLSVIAEPHRGNLGPLVLGEIKKVFMLHMVDSGHSCVFCMNSLIIPPPSLVKNEHSSVMYNLLSLFTHLLSLEAIAIS